MLPLFKALFMTSNPIMVKDALAQTGFPVGGVRLPLVPPTEAQSAELKRVLDHLGL
jgi:4-hydroxy-tetrahydrodipicolinate synthase